MGNPYSEILENKARTIISSCKVSDAYSSSLDGDIEHPGYISCTALWDTGAESSVISHKLATNLNIPFSGYAQMVHANGSSLVKTYHINVLLPNKIEIQVLPVMESDLIQTDMLIGMDIISLCDFAITHPNEKTLFSFSIPSTHTTDYTK